MENTFASQVWPNLQNRFSGNALYGRLECPPEELLAYARRTGWPTEESLDGHHIRIRLAWLTREFDDNGLNHWEARVRAEYENAVSGKIGLKHNYL